MLDRLVRLDVAAARELDALDDAREVAEQRAVDPLAAVRERRVRPGHVERVDRELAETDREERVELAADPERMRGVDDGLRA